MVYCTHFTRWWPQIIVTSQIHRCLARTHHLAYFVWCKAMQKCIWSINIYFVLHLQLEEKNLHVLSMTLSILPPSQVITKSANHCCSGTENSILHHIISLWYPQLSSSSHFDTNSLIRSHFPKTSLLPVGNVINASGIIIRQMVLKVTLNVIFPLN